MLFHCTKGDCRFWGEGAAMPDACPRCGGALTAGERAKMSGDDWCALGVFWMEQDGAEEKAVSCFRRAARLGSGWGACNLGLCLEQGTGIEADPRQAVWLYQQAAEMGACPPCATWRCAMRRASGSLRTPVRQWSCTAGRRSTAPPGPAPAGPLL